LRDLRNEFSTGASHVGFFWLQLTLDFVNENTERPIETVPIQNAWRIINEKKIISNMFSRMVIQLMTS
jgi:hypothetical protein